MVTRTLEFLSTFLWQAPPLEMQWEPRESFPDEAKKGTLISNCGVQNGAPIEFCRDPRCSSRVETGNSGNFLSCCKGVKDPLEVEEGRCDFPRDAATENGLISPGGENLLVFPSCGSFLSSYDGDLRDPLVWPQERPVAMRVARGLSGFLSSRCRVLSYLLEPRLEREVSSPVLT